MAIKKKDAELYKKYSPKLAEVLKLPNDEKFFDHYFSKIIAGDEINELNDKSFDDWLENRLKPNLIFLDKKDYLISAIEALETYKGIAGTDFGTSRVRDEAQLWADKIRGYLAEQAFKKILLNNFNIECHLPHQAGTAKENMPSDIPLIKYENEKEFKKAKLKISIKQTKWNGVWLDVGQQYNHSDIYIQIKVNTGTEHLVSYLKELNFFNEILLKKGIEESVITEQKKNKILSRIKNFDDISLFAYVAGFREIKDLSFKCTGKKLIKNLLVNSAEGLITDEVLNRLAKDYKVNKGQINFAGIGKFSTYPRYVTNTGRLKYRKEDWKKIIDKL